MQTKRIGLLCLVCLFYTIVFSQSETNIQAADKNSMQLFKEQKWKELLQYGKEEIAQGVDFPLLRMRAGYAAFALGNYSESLKQYSNVYDKDKDNKIALYYVYLDNLYLNNIPAARFFGRNMTEESRITEKIIKNKISSLNLEYSYKVPDIVQRGNAQYERVGLNVQFGYRFELQQAVAFYNQVINEPALTLVRNNNNINIDQKEYYGKLIFAASGNLSIIGGMHYLHIPFNNYIYNNIIVFGGAKYATPYVFLQGMVHVSNIRDSAYTQGDAVITTYPLGNTNLYTITKASYGKGFTLTQVAGIKILKNTWLEGNITAGQYQILLDNDALYVFDDIDTKRFKAGGSIYMLFTKKVILSINYNFENKIRYGTTNNYYNQHSITGGISWKF